MSTDEFNIHRGIVRAVNSSTGISFVEFPSHLNAGGLQEVSNVGLSQTVPGTYDMPYVGSMVFLAIDARDRAFYVAQPGNAAASASMAVHLATFDPHPQYTTASELSTALAPYTTGRRNLLHNGDFRVKDAGTIIDGSTVSQTTTTSAYLRADRWGATDGISSLGKTWYAYNNSGTSGDVAPFANMLIIQAGQKAVLAAGDFLGFYQNLEGRDIQYIGFGDALAKPVTLSFQVASANIPAPFTGIVELSRVNNGTSRFCSVPFTFSGDTHQRMVCTFPADSGGVRENSNNLTSLTVAVYFAAGSTYNTGNVANLNTSWTTTPTNNTRLAGCSNFLLNAGTNQINLTEFQLEIGSVATPFDYQDYGTELALCQRYYRRFIQPKMFGVQPGGLNQALGRMGMQLFPTMRAAPTLNLSGTIGVYDGINTGTLTSITTNYSTSDVIEFDGACTIAANGIGSGVERMLTTYQTGTGYIEVDARI